MIASHLLIGNPLAVLLVGAGCDKTVDICPPEPISSVTTNPLVDPNQTTVPAD